MIAMGSSVAIFQRERRSLLAIAARILGSAGEAEDVVQEAFIRWHRVDHGAVRAPAAFLTRMVTRLSINVLKSAHRRRMEPVGFSLPEPETPSSGWRRPDALEMQVTAEELSSAFGLVLERLTPVERAVFLLHECFGYGYAEIAPVVGKTEENCRQIERRARQHLARGARRRPAAGADRELLFGSFMRAAREGQVDALVGILAQGAAAHSSARKLDWTTSDGTDDATAGRCQLVA